MQVLYPTISLWLAAILAAAAIHKISAWPRFLAVMAAYGLVSDARLKFAGMAFVAAEICAALLLVFMLEAGLSLAVLSYARGNRSASLMIFGLLMR